MTFAVPLTLGDRRILRPGNWRPARSLAWMVAMIFAIMLAFGLFSDALSHTWPNEPALRFMVKAAGALIVLCTYVAMVRAGELRWPDELSLKAAPAGTLIGLALGAVLFCIVMAVLTGAGLYDFAYHGPAPAWRGAGLALESAVLEEVLVRGVVLRLIWRAFGPVTAFVASAFLFGLGHLANPGANLLSVACVGLEAGVMLGSFYALTGRLWMSIGVHAGWNFTQGYVFGAQVSGGDFGSSIATSTARGNMPVWLTGGNFGPEATLPALLICTATGAFVIWLGWRAGRFAAAPHAGEPE